MPTFLSALARLAGARPRVAPPEAKRSAAAPLIALQYQRQPVWSPRDYGSFAREGFAQNPVVYRCVRMIAESAAAVPLDLFEGGMEHEDHPLLDLLRAPNPTQTAPDLLESWYGFLLVAGNSYMEAVGTGADIRELYVLRPDRMTIVPGADGWPLSYDYTVSGQTVSYSGEAAPGVRKVLHLGLFHPSNDYYGLSPIEAAATAIDIHNAASAWNKGMLDNSALPSGALVYNASGGQLTSDQYERLKAELEAGFQGARNAGRPMLLEGGLDWRAMSMTPKDMDFIESKRQAARDIALALGVPPMLLGIPGDNTHANYAEAHRSFWRHTVLPLVGRSAKALSGWLGPAYGGGLELRPDLDGIEALSSERDDLWKRIGGASFLTDAEKRAAVGYADEMEDAGEAEGKFSHEQPRVPAGSSEGGRWTSDGGAGGFSGPASATNQPRVQVAELLPNPAEANRVLSDAQPTVWLPAKAGGPPAQLAQDVPDAGLPNEPTAEEAYRRLLDKVATSRDSGQVLTAQDITRVNVALTAEDYVGSTRWSLDSHDPRVLAMGFLPGTNKCNVFVAQVLDWNSAGPGYPNAGTYIMRPPRPDQWADRNYAIPGWVALPPGQLPEPGDVAAQAAHFLNASGHAMIVGTGNTLVGTVDGRDVSPQGVVARVPMKQYIVPPQVADGQIVFRRFVGK